MGPESEGCVLPWGLPLPGCVTSRFPGLSFLISGRWELCHVMKALPMFQDSLLQGDWPWDLLTTPAWSAQPQGVASSQGQGFPAPRGLTQLSLM